MLQAPDHVYQTAARILGLDKLPDYSAGHRIPNLIVQRYTAVLREIMSQFPQPPSHVFVRPASAASRPRWPLVSRMSTSPGV